MDRETHLNKTHVTVAQTFPQIAGFYLVVLGTKRTDPPPHAHTPCQKKAACWWILKPAGFGVSAVLEKPTQQNKFGKTTRSRKRPVSLTDKDVATKSWPQDIWVFYLPATRSWVLNNKLNSPLPGMNSKRMSFSSFFEFLRRWETEEKRSYLYNVTVDRTYTTQYRRRKQRYRTRRNDVRVLMGNIP